MLDVQEFENPILRIGNSVFVRTVTFHYTGRITDMDNESLILEDAAWIADSGRFSIVLKNGDLGEVEPYPDLVYINRATIVDASVWMHDLPQEVK